MSEFNMTVNTQAEEDFFVNALKPTDSVLEFGSGASTNFIAKHVKRLCSIENNHDWFTKVASGIMPNVHLYYVEQNGEPEPGHDGTKEQYLDYVQKAIELAAEFGKFDVIFIDGRARVACAEICEKIGHKDTKVFIHDYNHPNPVYTREEYFPAEEWLERVDGELTMWQFKIKSLQEPEKNKKLCESPEVKKKLLTTSKSSSVKKTDKKPNSESPKPTKIKK